MASTSNGTCEHCASSRAGTYTSAERRWEGVGPYYAMFPTAFADAVILRHSCPGDTVLDPFAGRGTTVYSAAVHGRHGVGIEINPVGWIYGRTKVGPAAEDAVMALLRRLGDRALAYRQEAASLPEFFQRAYSRDVRRFLSAARSELDWRHKHVDRTLMALLLVNLHGKSGSAMSAQMRQTKAMSPGYALRWWSERGLVAPALDPVEFLVGRVGWRYRFGCPETSRSAVHLGDSARILPRLARPHAARRARLILTSPPYFSVTDYHYDQWLRLWLLGGSAVPRRIADKRKAKFDNLAEYAGMLTKIFTAASRAAREDATVYVRTYDRPLTLEATLHALRVAFPAHSLRKRRAVRLTNTQSRLFGQETRFTEVDLVLHKR